jgi:hypothetical protein
VTVAIVSGKGGERNWEEPKWLDQADLRPILEAVKGHIPANLDKAQLLSDLKRAARDYWAGGMLREEPSKRRRRADKIVEVAQRLKLLLDDGQRPPVTYQSPMSYCAVLDHLIGDINTNRSLAPQHASKLGLGEVSAFEQLIYQLRTTFETHFGTKAGYTRSKIDNRAPRKIPLAKSARI